MVGDRTCLWKYLLAGKLASLEPALTMHTAVPPQSDCLAISYNNIQLIYLICSFLENHSKTSPDRKLVITSNKEIPVQLCGSTITQEPDLTCLIEKADVIIVQQAILLARSGSKYNQIIADHTDVFVLHIFYHNQRQLKSNMIMSGTSEGRKVIDIRGTSQRSVSINDK